jgi:hypothetical protein
MAMPGVPGNTADKNAWIRAIRFICVICVLFSGQITPAFPPAMARL